MTDENEVQGRAKGGVARAKALTPEERKDIAKKGAEARWGADGASIQSATHIGELHIGELALPCAVLPDGTRVISQGGIATAFGPVTGGYQARKRAANEHTGDLPPFLIAASLNPFISSDLRTLVSSPIKYRDPRGGPVRNGIDAGLLPKVCEVWLQAADAGALTKIQEPVAIRANALMRGLAHTGIIALVDEATGYQRDRAKDALAQILEAFVAKELQPWVKTFPSDYYEHLFRLRGLPYPPENSKYRPQYFGVLTNDIVYKRLAPGILEELKKENAKDEKKGRLHQRLTPATGHPRLREHLVSAVTVMKLSRDYPDFIEKLNMIHPRYGDTMSLELSDEDRG